MSTLVEVKVPDIGDFSDIPVIEIAVAVGDSVAIDDSLVTLESEKATVDVPSSVAGVIKELRVSIGTRVSQGSLVALIEATAETALKDSATTQPPAPASAPPPVATKTPAAAVAAMPLAASTSPALPATMPAPARGRHASPSVRQYARELGVDLSLVSATGPKGRIQREDINAFIKGALQGKVSAQGAQPTGAGNALNLLPWPQVDFEKFGAVERQALPRIRKISAQNLARNWVMIPAVTYHEEADITSLEAFRLELNQHSEKNGHVKITMLAFLIKACAFALKQFPEFNSSLQDDAGEMTLVLKKYFNIAFAADTPHGLVVPVIKSVDTKSVSEIAAECGSLAKKARDGKLSPSDMTGACFTISSVGGIGGTAFSPIINAPEVAILGVSRSVMKPVWTGSSFEPRLTLPLSLSADHRVIDGALATRFNAYLATLLGDMRRILI